MYTPIDELPPCDLRNFSGDKKRTAVNPCTVACYRVACPFFVVLYFVTSFIFCDLVFCGFFYCEFHGGQKYMSARRIVYAWFICLLLFLAYCVSNSPVFCLPFLKPFYAVPLSIGPKNKHVLFGTKMIALLLGSMVFCMVMQNMWICCVCWV